MTLTLRVAHLHDGLTTFSGLVGGGFAYSLPCYGPVYCGDFGESPVWGESCWHCFRFRLAAEQDFSTRTWIETPGEAVTVDDEPELLAAAFLAVAGKDDETGRLLVAAFRDLEQQKKVTDCVRVAADRLRDDGREAEADLLLSRKCLVSAGRVLTWKGVPA